MQVIKSVIKSSGITQPYNSDKILKVLVWACQNRNVNPENLLHIIEKQLIDKMTTQEIQRVAIKTSADLISVENPDFQYVAGNLEMFALRKQVFNQFHPIPLYEHITNMVNSGKYDPELITKWTKEEIDEFGSYINHDKDMQLTYAGVKQIIGKYLVQDRTSGAIFETPQFAFMLIGMCLHQDEKNQVKRIQYVKDFYDAVSDRKLSIPTPIMAGVRTPTRQFSSCVVIESGDSLSSINACNSAIVSYISQRAGIGINAGRIRAEGSPIRGGEAYHTGVIPFYKHFQTAVKSCSQGGVRGGAATLYYPIWHLEVENLLVLKNNKGTEENRVRHLDYGVQINELFYKRLINDDYITLFSPDVAGGLLYDLQFSDEDAFEKLYIELEKNPNVRKKRIKAVTLFSTLANERIATGRKYIFNSTEVNRAGSFNVPIKQSNLCLEIAIPTSPLSNTDPYAGEIGLCTLMALVLGNFEIDELPKLTEIAVRALDNLLDYQNYPVEAAYIAKKRRSLGIGVTNYASYLASNYLMYNEKALPFVHELFEAIQYNLLRASNILARERGACELFNETRYHDGYLPIDWYNKHVDELVKPVYKCDWEDLRNEIQKYGLRNSTLSALMPCESSSQVSNSTNGIEPPRGLVSVKSSKDGSYNQIVPNENNQLDFYDLLWDMTKRGNRGYLSHVAVMQKFVDQSISANTNYDPENQEDGKIHIKEVLGDMIYAQHYGVKTLYYANTRDHSGSDDLAETESDCETCKI